MTTIKKVWRKIVDIFLTVLIAICGAIARSP
jgi:hypothetical protein